VRVFVCSKGGGQAARWPGERREQEDENEGRAGQAGERSGGGYRALLRRGGTKKLVVGSAVD